MDCWASERQRTLGLLDTLKRGAGEEGRDELQDTNN